MNLLEYIPEKDDSKLLLSEEFKQYFVENAVLVGGSIPISSLIACILEFKDLE